MTNIGLIMQYTNDINFIGQVSELEFEYTLFVRSALETKVDTLTAVEKLLLLEQDKRLLANASNYYKQLMPIYIKKGNEPINHWWYHLDMVASGELIVDLDNQQVYLRDNDQAATMTA